jgi:hypothetical protein
MLDQNIVFNIVDVQFKTPGHRHFLFDRKVNEMSNDFVLLRSQRRSLDGDIVGLI